ncbi:RHS repeat protein [Burkholderia ubonensis]|uniref:RHS repeat protein n=1 Tax=Burkholderia ubonensis TaxID=101571 RepID=UPI00075BE2A7|nr:RHS repeat protein [Burkholderia ubonensis]KVK96214.1 hypothetical protein WJ45_20060 [Burkholderia ubonensis]KVQ44345.1 hypothetical protein WK04_15565 [Burkholderia ubonensis]
MSSPIYSNASNFPGAVQGGVDPRTGYFGCTIRLATLKGNALAGPDVALTLIYGALNTANAGFGQGWALNLSRYDRSTRTLSLSTGETFKIVEAGTNLIIPDQKLVSFKFELLDSGDYQVTHKSGLVELLSNRNDAYAVKVPTRLIAPSGRHVTLSWQPAGTARHLVAIRDEQQALMNASYTDAAVTVTCFPNDASEQKAFQLTLKNQQLAGVQTTVGKQQATWRFVYGTSGPLTLLTGVTYPTGLNETVQYKADGHKLPNHAPFASLPYVISHTQFPGNGQPSVETTFSYTDHNFLGYGSQFDWKDDEDNLYNSPNDYQYGSTVTLTATGRTTQRTYNKFHLMTQEAVAQNGKHLTTAITYYALTNQAFKDQPAQCQLPKQKTVTYAASGSSRVETTSYEFDTFGNATSETQPTGVQTARIYYDAQGETGCPAAPNDFCRFIKSETVTPASSSYAAPTRTTIYTYQKLPAADAQIPYLIVGQTEVVSCDGSEVSRSEQVYWNDTSSQDHGRLKQLTLTLDRKQTVQAFAYQHDGNQLTKTVTVTGFDQVQASHATTLSSFTGVTLATQDAQGVVVNYAYDSLGRVISETISPGTQCEATRQHSYQFPDAGNSNPTTTVTDVSGVKLRHTYDGLGRVCLTEQQDVDGTSCDFRAIRAVAYDSAGRRQRDEQNDWLRSDGNVTQVSTRVTLEYDDWGQVSALTFSDGHRKLQQADPVSMITKTGIDGEGWWETTVDLFGNPTTIAQFTRTGTQVAQVRNEYDGLGRRACHADSSGRKTYYAYDAFDRINKTRLPDGNVITTQYASQSTDALATSISVNNTALGTQAFDGLKRLTETVVGGRTTQYDYTGASPYPSTMHTPAGETLTFQVEPQLANALMQVQADPVAQRFAYQSQTGALLQADSDSDESRHFQYYPSGFLKSETYPSGSGAKTATYQHSLGEPTATIHRRIRPDTDAQLRCAGSAAIARRSAFPGRGDL